LRLGGLGGALAPLTGPGGRDASLCPPVDSGVSDFVGIADSVESDVLPSREPQLSASQSRELTSLISEFEEIFSEQPGKTALVHNHIKLTPGATPSRSAPHLLLYLILLLLLAVVACLFQVVEDLEHPICYLSRKLNKHQRNYSTVEKEAFGLLFATRALSVYIGSSPVTVYTDHSPLQFLQRMSNYNQKLLRWNLELQEYNLTIKHRSGRDNILPDLLSRPS